MSHAVSPSAGRVYGVARVCETWGVARSTYYDRQRQAAESRPPKKRGPKTPWTDAERSARSWPSRPSGEGHRKVWARLRMLKGIRTSKGRVLRALHSKASALGLAQQFHDEVGSPLIAAHLEGRHDQGVRQLGCSPALELEALEASPELVGGLALARDQLLDRDLPLQLGIKGAVDDAHSTPPELSEEEVAPQPGRRGVREGGLDLGAEWRSARGGGARGPSPREGGEDIGAGFGSGRGAQIGRELH